MTNRILLAEVGGSPAAFDLDKLQCLIKLLHSSARILWGSDVNRPSEDARSIADFLEGLKYFAADGSKRLHNRCVTTEESEQVEAALWQARPLEGPTCLSSLKLKITDHIDSLPGFPHPNLEPIEPVDSQLRLSALERRSIRDIVDYLWLSFPKLETNLPLTCRLLDSILGRREEILASFKEVESDNVTEFAFFSATLPSALDYSDEPHSTVVIKGKRHSTCPFCHLILPILSSGSDEDSWRRHVLRHAQAYSCTLQPCDHWDLFVPSELAHHDRTYHNSRHLKHEDLATCDIVEVTSTREAILICPFCTRYRDFPELECDLDYDSRVDKFYQHLSDHLERLTLATLPQVRVSSSRDQWDSLWGTRLVVSTPITKPVGKDRGYGDSSDFSHDSGYISSFAKAEPSRGGARSPTMSNISDSQSDGGDDV